MPTPRHTPGGRSVAVRDMHVVSTCEPSGAATVGTQQRHCGTSPALVVEALLTGDPSAPHRRPTGAPPAPHGRRTGVHRRPIRRPTGAAPAPHRRSTGPVPPPVPHRRVIRVSSAPHRRLAPHRRPTGAPPAPHRRPTVAIDSVCPSLGTARFQWRERTISLSIIDRGAFRLARAFSPRSARISIWLGAGDA